MGGIPILMEKLYSERDDKMPWVQENYAHRVYYDSLVKARSHAVKILESKKNFDTVAIFRKLDSKKEMGHVMKYNGSYEWVDYKPSKYGVGHWAMYKNGKLER